MAARKSDNHNGPISYLDDVPFKINDKFRCPAKVGLPVGFCLPDCLSVLADLQYDFSLERRSVRWGAELAEARAAEARAAELARVELESREHSPPAQDPDGGLAGGGKRPRPAEEQDALPPALNPLMAALRHNAILTPLPAPARQTTPSIPEPQYLNLADFEREEDPFDKLELKTLDDREELRNILQSQPQPQQQSVSPPGEPQPELASRGSTPPPQLSATSLPAKTAFSLNGLVAQLDMDRAGSLAQGRTMDPDRPCNIRSLTFPKLSDQGDLLFDSYSPAPVPPSLSTGSPPAPQQKTEELPRHTQNGAPKQINAGPLPRGAALLNLSPSGLQCVETIVSMGYSYEGVLRAMQRRGKNVEQVLEYLFTHTRLCERGFEPSAVEEGLEMYQCSEEKALEFLSLMTRFGEMGFERDTIKEVLLVHNNDQEKALEDLMSRAAAS
ncbi:ubiquitin-associated protein 1-like [Oncorhynchus keta]|uniref:ubiquitin-associated protein 1-like n=1 Tax=Oncorhynchus keta TaxID=8018 RepID=UPI0015F8DC01|nr:ubiquitin-associated protein 1-like [Oncorhynchus keta]XP_035653391.1 ubiquitin-associated protein 1-like [Oncorhynchus keta]